MAQPRPPRQLAQLEAKTVREKREHQGVPSSPRESGMQHALTTLHNTSRHQEHTHTHCYMTAADVASPVALVASHVLSVSWRLELLGDQVEDH